MNGDTMFDLIDDPTYTHANVTISTDTRILKNGEPRTTGQWAVYVNGKRLHPGIPTYGDAGVVRDLYVNGTPSDDPRWQWYGGKQPSPRSDDVRRARAEVIVAESGCDFYTAWDRANYEWHHNLLDPHQVVRDSGVTT
jgi:hypothetical protein